MMMKSPGPRHRLHKRFSALLVFALQIFLIANVDAGRRTLLALRGRDETDEPKECPIKCGQRPGITDDTRSDIVSVEEPQFRLFGGTVVTEESLWPWVARFVAEECDGVPIICTATLISKQHAVTSAHCMYGNVYLCKKNHKNQKGAELYLEYDIEKIHLEHKGNKYSIKDYLINALYDEQNPKRKENIANDIAVLTDTKPIDDAQAVCVAKRFLRNIDSSGDIVGYGSHNIDSNGKYEHDGQLRHAHVHVAGPGLCTAKWIVTTKLCTATQGVGALVGDSGSVFTTRHLPSKIHFAHGLLSQYYETATADRPNNPDAYTLLPDQCSFINMATKGEVDCVEPYNLPKSCLKKPDPEAEPSK